MSEFKFSCPKCKGDILCDTSYSNRQINCPICQQLIVVPKSIGTKAGTGVVKKILTVVVILVVLGALGYGGWYFYSKHKEKVAAAAGNPAAQVAAPSSQSVASAMDTTEKMHLAYSSLDTLSAKGTAVMEIDMSGVTAADVNPKAKNTKARPAGMPTKMTMTTDVSMKLAKPDKYLVQGSMKQAAGPMISTNTVAAWSTGQTNYTLMMFNGGAFKNFTTVKDRNQALMMNGQGGALAVGIPQLFFDDTGTLAKLISDWGQTGDEAVDGENCAVLTGKLMGQKLTLWVSKTSYLAMKSQITLGGALSDADIDTAIALNTDTNMPPAKLAQLKAQAKQQMAMMTKIKGTITETYSYETNNTFSASDFNYPVPRGTKLVRGM